MTAPPFPPPQHIPGISETLQSFLITISLLCSWVPLVPERPICMICNRSLFVFSTGLKIIDILTDQSDERAGSHLESCTTDVRTIRILNHATYSNRLVLVEAPELDNSSNLEIVSKWLQRV